MPATDAELVEHFLVLVDEYETLAAAFPVEQATFTIGGDIRPQTDRWHRLIRAFALRKFFTTSSDTVFCTKVYEAHLRLLGITDTVPLREAYLDAVESVIHGGSRYGDRAGGGTVNTEQVVTDLLYGIFLHGDIERAKRAKRREGLIDENALWIWTHGAEHQLRWLSDQIRAGIDGAADLGST
jgi:hypothetical protein